LLPSIQLCHCLEGRYCEVRDVVGKRAPDAVPHVAARQKQQNAFVNVMPRLPDGPVERLVAAVVMWLRTNSA
jgi:hypothetical protein